MSSFKRTKSFQSSQLLSLPVDVQILILQLLDPSTLLSLIKVSPIIWQVAYKVLECRLVKSPLRVSLIFHQANSWRFSAEFECTSCDPSTADLLFRPSQRVSVRYFHNSNKDGQLPYKKENQEFVTPNLLKDKKRYVTELTEHSLSVQPKSTRKLSWRLTYMVTKKAFISFVPKICIGGQWLTPQEFVCSPKFFFKQKRDLGQYLQEQPKKLLHKLLKGSSGKTHPKEYRNSSTALGAYSRNARHL
ncbi:hypothetical protein K493DRAFT_315327 [Basidiobolus meristosporus CBS 931.73]|uniref:F-box domain-containing protein n=1 Tax=Basidiobolus meristosporus CBS 931.73 TaxID=1314790 RepID=A0A1Y1Y9W3_9FUNG|nr:hypothetical protein K493DRAFT_315327 [Basidiobolus meristosporus CBS 931.73]|eukprot:ORX94810.1 hypothetical protein K493DRAFT_315327 [Basidiobolus meristosporus CBS 931.73]